MNNMYPSDPITGVVDFSNPHFEYSLNNVYFYKSTTGNTSNSLYTLNNIVVNNSPESVYYVNNYNDNPSELNEVNDFYTQSTGSSNAILPSVLNIGSPMMCVNCQAYTHGGWAVAGGMAHELGHNVDLCHTYLGGGCPTSIAGMNSTNNWFADLFGSPYPGNAPHITSTCPYADCPPINYAWDADPYDNTLPMADRLTNNIMGNQGNSRNYLSPSQIGKVHRSLYLTSVRKYVIDNCYDQNNPIIVDSDEIWDFNIRVYEDIIIENNAECEITCHVELPYNAKIIVRDGSRLIVDGSITGVNEEAWKGQIEIEPGGELVLDDDGVIYLGEGGKLLIDQSSTDAATLTYNAGAEIILDHNTSELEILGNLHIGNSAQFTFTGNGFIKFSNPGPDATYNITAGNGASILFSGSGQTDKVLEVNQATVHFPEMASLTFENCRIEMASGTPGRRMQTDAPYPVTFNNVKVTSSTGTHNNHRSFLFIGQSYVTINNSVFEYGQYGIYGNLAWTDGSPLYITNSTFRYNTEGINIYGKGLHLDNCFVINNTSYGVYCNAMSFTSEFIDCSINDNNYGIYYQGSASADVDIDNTSIQSNTLDGVITSGAFDLNMVCAFINDNKKGINVANGTFVKPLTCNLSGNDTTIYFNYGSVLLLNKNNQLQADNNHYALSGFIAVNSLLIKATGNRWSSVSSQSPVLGTHYFLIKYPPTKPMGVVTVTDAHPAFSLCFQFNPMMSQTTDLLLDVSEDVTISLPIVIVDKVSMPVDQAVSLLESLSNSINSESDYINIIEKYSELILSCNNYTSSEALYWQSIANGSLHNIISNFQAFVHFDKENSSFSAGVEKVIKMNEIIVENPELPYPYNVEYNLDIALLNRMTENYSAAIEKLEAMTLSLSDIQNKSELDYTKEWLCKIYAEKSAAEGLLTMDEFMLAINDCELCMTTKSGTGESNIKNDTEQYEKESYTSELSSVTSFSVSPNPNKGSFKISFSNPCNNCEVRIINSIGQIVKYIKPSETGLHEISVDGLQTGHYKVIYIIVNKIIDSQTVVVE